jgi:hypothetical protein
MDLIAQIFFFTYQVSPPNDRQSHVSVVGAIARYW